MDIDNFRAIKGLNTFKPDLLLTEDDVRASLGILEATLNGADTAGVLESALQIPYCLEYILSAVNSDTFVPLNDWIMRQFPTTIEDYLSNPFPRRALSYLSLHLLEYEFGEHIPSHLWTSLQAVKSASSCLEALCDLIKSGKLLEEDNGTLQNKTSTSSRTHKHSVDADVNVNIKAFRDIGIPVPSSKMGAERAAADILGGQRCTLESYLETLRQPKLAGIFKHAYIPEVVAEEGLDSFDQDAIAALSPTYEMKTNASLPSTFLQPHLYSEVAKGFGPWRIYLSGRAIHDLTELQKSDGKSFRIALNKLKDLSHGHFSKTNQKRLTNDNVPVDIFEARLPGAPRIVYQIDCIQEYESDGFRQVLTIYGIYDHSKLGRAFWDRLGRQRAREGRLYRNRAISCRARSHPRNTGDDTYEPEFFGPTSSLSLSSKSVDPIEDNPEDLEELHELVASVKYFPVSQNLLNSILRD
ncbi:hypothetical protein EVG20_g8592 [Dentipellis fragilis]|uniref:Uncharacterized protein n=1 Tax=Dentipellis fragilis TaxID=205917 RepID=A0A4Y9Y6B0_9AGAM|nr:hypothetical protein EVG20_g8592 [Dentipellis fragilis]